MLKLLILFINSILDSFDILVYLDTVIQYYNGLEQFFKKIITKTLYYLYYKSYSYGLLHLQNLLYSIPLKV